MGGAQPACVEIPSTTLHIKNTSKHPAIHAGRQHNNKTQTTTEQKSNDTSKRNTKEWNERVIWRGSTFHAELGNVR